MGKIIDISNGVGWDDFLARARSITSVVSLMGAANSIFRLSQDHKVFASVLQTVRTKLSPWSGERVRAVTASSDWMPEDLRSDQSVTIYFCLRVGEIDAFSSVMRVFVGMHMRYFLKKDEPPQGTPPILFLLDEAPRMKYMSYIEECIDVGRDRRLQLWIIAQNEGQIERYYPDGKGLIGKCAVRVYMNPALGDETAKRLSEQLGFKQVSLEGGQKKPLVEPSALAGPEYKENIIVFAGGSKPMRLDKVYAHADDRFSRLLAGESSVDASFEDAT